MLSADFRGIFVHFLQGHMQEILLWSIQCNKQTSCVLALDFSTSIKSLASGKTVRKQQFAL